MQAESLLVNAFVLIIAMSFHPAFMDSMNLQAIVFRIFANSFFTVVIGMGWAFLSSYSLKKAQHKLTSNFDNFDVSMMILAPLVSNLMAEALQISGLLSLITCAFFLSLYGKKNLEKERSQLL